MQGLAQKPLPFGVSPMLRCGGQNQKWPTRGRFGYITPCHPHGRKRFKAGDKITSGPQADRWLHNPCRGQGVPKAEKRGIKTELAENWAVQRHNCWSLGWRSKCFKVQQPKFRSGPKVGGLATEPLPSKDSLSLQSGVKKKITKGPQLVRLDAQPLRSSGSPKLPNGGRNQNCPEVGRLGYTTPTVWVLPSASKRGHNRNWPKSGSFSHVTPTV